MNVMLTLYSRLDLSIVKSDAKTTTNNEHIAGGTNSEVESRSG